MANRLWCVASIIATILYRSDGFQISALQDPLITTAGQERFHLDIPCRYELVNVVTNAEQGYCHVLLYAFNTRIRGGFFLGGWDLAVTIYDDNHGTQFKESFSAEGTATNGNFEYSMSRSPDGGDTWLGVDGRYFGSNPDVVFIQSNNKVLFRMPGCHFQISFKAADTVLKPKESDPSGVKFNIESSEVHAWPRDKNLVGLPPKGQGVSAERVAEIYELPLGEAFTERVFHAHISQSFPGASKQCGAIRNLVNTCTVEQLRSGFEMCTAFLKDRNYVRCMSGETEGSDVIMEHFKNCIDKFCEGDIIGLMHLNCENCLDK